MLKLVGNSEDDDNEATGSNTGSVEKTSKRGRPKGSKNKVSADARELLAQHGLAGVRALCAIAAGMAIYRPREADGRREKLVPDLGQMLTAQKAILDRLVPSLKATELTGADGKDLIPAAEPQDHRQISRAILQVLGSAVLTDDAAEAFAEDTIPRGKHEFTAALLPDEVDMLDLSDTPPPARVGPPIVDEVGDSELVVDRGDFIRCIEVRGGRSRWAIISHRGEHITSMWATRETARASCQQFIATGMISR
jgi:hypothetical protein